MCTRTHLEHLWRRVLPNLPKPLRAAVEGGLVADVVHQDEGVRGPVVALGDAAEPLLAGRVPDLELEEG